MKHRNIGNSIFIGVIGALLCALLLGCEDKTAVPPEVPPVAQPVQPAASAPEKSEQWDGNLNHLPRPTVDLKAQDEQDDPLAPRALPKSGDADTWVKVQPIRVVLPDRLAELVPDANTRSILQRFRIAKVAVCTYQRNDTPADVFYVETENPLDTFGIFSVLNEDPGSRSRGDGSFRGIETSSDIWKMLGWQGKSFVQVKFPQSSTSLKSYNDLFSKILFNVPSADPPILVQAIPREKQDSAKVWVVRDAEVLRFANTDKLKNLDFARINQLLGLTGEPMFSMAAVPVGENAEQELLWLVQYPKAEDATAAYQRIKQAIQTPETTLDRHVEVAEPKGTLLIGTWTAALEASQQLLPKLHQVLP